MIERAIQIIIATIIVFGMLLLIIPAIGIIIGLIGKLL